MSLIIGITGSSCSGKTTLANLLSKLPNTVSISHDSFYKSIPDEITNLNDVNFDDPERLDNEKLKIVINNFKNRSNYYIPNYNFETGKSNGGITFQCRNNKILIIEGIFLFHDDELTDLFDMKIFVDTDIDECLKRRIERDQVCHGKFLYQDIINRWNRDVLPAYNKYTRKYKNTVNYIIDGNNPFEENLKNLEKHINTKFFEKQ